MNGSRFLFAAALVVAGSAVVGGCQVAAQRQSTVVHLTTLNSSGVTGTVTLTDLGDGRVVVDLDVEPGGNLDMPAHIHPGSCEALIPQPVHPLENVVNGSSVTTVRATLDELTAGGLAVNLHRSNDDLGTYTACAEL
jgi:hypothetical protein